MLKRCLSLLAFFLSATLSRTQLQAPPNLIFELRDSYNFDTASMSSVRPCRFSGTPAPTVTWTFNGNRLPTSSESMSGIYYFPSDGTLVIERAGSGSNGEYTCVGENIYGTRSATTQFTFSDTSVPWYISWYMWFIYTIVIWAFTIPAFVAWFFYSSKKAVANLPAPDGWIGN